MSQLNRCLKIIEPWGMALALIALFFEINARLEKRTRGAWELLALSGQGNSGKAAALEYLNSQSLFKSRTNFTEIDLGVDDSDKRGSYLRGKAIRRQVKLRWTRHMVEDRSICLTNLVSCPRDVSSSTSVCVAKIKLPHLWRVKSASYSEQRW